MLVLNIVVLKAFLRMRCRVNVSEVQQVGFPHHAAQQNAWCVSWVLLYWLLLSVIFWVVLRPQQNFDLTHFLLLL